MDELLKSVITGMPSFIGLVLAVIVLREQNQRLLAMIERMVQACEEDMKEPEVNAG